MNYDHNPDLRVFDHICLYLLDSKENDIGKRRFNLVARNRQLMEQRFYGTIEELLFDPDVYLERFFVDRDGRQEMGFYHLITIVDGNKVALKEIDHE